MSDESRGGDRYLSSLITHHSSPITGFSSLISHHCAVVRLGLVDYEEAWDLQRRTVERRVAGEIPDTIILLEHSHVYTLGRGGHVENVLLDESALAAKGAK